MTVRPLVAEARENRTANTMARAQQLLRLLRSDDAVSVDN